MLSVDDRTGDEIQLRFEYYIDASQKEKMEGKVREEMEKERCLWITEI